MNTDELSEQNKYFHEYKTRSANQEISRNYAKAMYDLFSTDLNLLTQNQFHFQNVNTLHNIHTNESKLPSPIIDLLDFKDKVILDFGCGRGEFCHDIHRKFMAHKTYGCDLATVDLGLTDQYESENCRFFTCGATSIPLANNSVDIITSFLVLEHVHEHNIDQMFKEFDRICRKGFIFSISHQSATQQNLRRCSKNLQWWQNKLIDFCDPIFMYYPSTDNYKWGTGMSTGLTRLICNKRI
jgi:ubiquinone/menaquinone biosynthesis C-methylase UbiE